MNRSIPLRIAALLTLLAAAPATARQADTTGLAEWEVQPGFRLDVRASGFRIPTGIAFVPRPGDRPDDPLYFVTELHGSIRVVANDGTVSTFAERFVPIRPTVPLPAGEGENGLGGICLDPETGYVFVTYAYSDTTGALKNGMTRFATRPHTFATAPSGRTSYDHIFARDRSANSHQIGPCQVRNGMVWVAVGDALESSMSHVPTSTQGKILRMTVEGRPVPDNPFYRADDATTASYVWAMGVRNVFGLELVGDRVFTAENGLNVDRFEEVERGGDYHWDGTDWSLSYGAGMVFAPAVSPVQLDYAPADYAPFPDDWRDRFFVALAGRADAAGPGLIGEKSVVAIDYDFSRRALRDVPKPLVRYRGVGYGGIVAQALGPDGLYFAPLYPRADGTSPVIRVSWAPARPHAWVIGSNVRPSTLMADKGCIGCHTFQHRGGSAGPSLDDPPLFERLEQRLSTPAYLDSLAAVDRIVGEPFTAYADARRAIANAAPSDRPAIWLRNHLLEPRFDNPASAMPDVGLTGAEAQTLTDFLLQPPATPPAPTLRQRLQLPPARYRYVAIAFGLGFVLPWLFMLALRLRRRGKGAGS